MKLRVLPIYFRVELHVLVSEFDLIRLCTCDRSECRGRKDELAKIGFCVFPAVIRRESIEFGAWLVFVSEVQLADRILAVELGFDELTSDGEFKMLSVAPVIRSPLL